MIDKNRFKKTFGKQLSNAGFSRKGSSWFLDGPDAILVLNLQKSDFDEKFYINLGIWLKALGEAEYPRENACHVQVRLTSVLPQDAELIERGCRLDAENDAAFNQLVELLVSKVIPFCTDCFQIDVLRAKVARGEFRKALSFKEA